ncbi:MAG: DUF1848 domain-containing protein [Calditrichaeota bacterium]|nr:MAG: DUF1848 domain-containing protein [Calditrichota bacterium]
MNNSRQKIISVSRRTDIPAFYTKWFSNRLTAGFAEVVNPFNARQVRTVSLHPDDVAALVFWTRNARPLFSKLSQLTGSGYRFYFHWTLNNYPAQLESNNPAVERAIAAFHQLAQMISADKIIWRYDPIVISSVTPLKWHIDNFHFLAGRLSGATNQCIFSFVDLYKKVERNMARMQKNGVEFYKPSAEDRQYLVENLAEIAEMNGIRLAACCEDAYLSIQNIDKARCIDSGLLQKIYPDIQLSGSLNPTRPQCGCFESIDIGAYDSCLFGCIYCYANTNFSKRSIIRYHSHDPQNPKLIPA